MASKQRTKPRLKKSPYPALVELRMRARKASQKPLSEEQLKKMGTIWPKEENPDDFVAWLRQCRRA